jgi:predicted GIY-YIG superfamily endonuclease
MDPNKPTHVYSLNLADGKKYVGLSQNPNKRINDHFNGNGAKWTQIYKPQSVNHIQKCQNLQNAKKAETSVYYNMKKRHGSSNVRGAGHTTIKYHGGSKTTKKYHGRSNVRKAGRTRRKKKFGGI